MKWGLSPLDWRSHAIDDQRDHSLGVLKAECGHLLMMIITLHEVPYGPACQACATWQQAALHGVRVPAEEFGATVHRADVEDPGPSGGTASV